MIWSVSNIICMSSCCLPANKGYLSANGNCYYDHLLSSIRDLLFNYPYTLFFNYPYTLLLNIPFFFLSGPIKAGAKILCLTFSLIRFCSYSLYFPLLYYSHPSLLLSSRPSLLTYYSPSLLDNPSPIAATIWLGLMHRLSQW